MNSLGRMQILEEKQRVAGICLEEVYEGTTLRMEQRDLGDLGIWEEREVENVCAREKAREEIGDGLKAEISGPDNAGVRDEAKAMAVVEAEPKSELVTQVKFGDGTMAMTQTMTYTEPVTGTKEVNKMENMTDNRVMDQTKTKVLLELGIVPQTKSEASSMSRLSAITKSTVRVVSGSEASFRSCSKADDRANIVSRYETKEETSIKSMARNKVGIGIKSTDEEEENICSWFWIGEEPSVVALV
ncbi:Armadillo repeat-containing X-linked protein 5 [Heterocephalus glaber]|uniref:Armadillo repeat-containing X-linked protein 5 n=1 Tax=Heterocephalus glaber TaxID=10181 RepID=G5B0C1_HETGA|nr:Armadillo repeat-containing X-linked protein 5 [Heterocephalus glaber]